MIVTAQRRAERLQDVPIAITVQSGEQLERAGVINLRDITTVTPGLRITGTGANQQPVIRGVQSQQTDPGNDPNVAIYLDGVYQPNQIANSFDLPDVQQIEVLKGPQGTLFGRNATGGAIRIFTLEPGFTPAGRLSLEYGRFSDVLAKGFVSGPLVGDTVAGSLSVSRQDSGGYTRDLVTGQNDVGGVRSTIVRGKLLAKPRDGVKLLLTVAYLDRWDGDTTTYGTINGNTIARLFPGAVFSDQPYEFATSRKDFLDSTVHMASLKADFDLAGGTLSSVTAYNKVDALYTQDGDASNYDLLYYSLNELQEDYSQEFIFSTRQDSRLRAVGGLFYYHSDGRYDPLDVLGSFAGPVPIFVWSRQVTEAYAAFGELSFDLTERLTLVGGARYSDEKRTAYGTFQFGSGPEPAMPRLGAKSWDSFTPRISLRYRFFDNDNFYVTYSEGFKSGGFNIAATDPIPFNPEKLRSIEMGIKTSPSRRLSANVATFYYDYTDQQVMTLAHNFNITANAASSEIYGLDADVMARATRDLTLTAGLSLLRAKFDRYPNAVVLEPLGGAACRCGNANVVRDVSGYKEPKSPKWTLGLSANYNHDFDFGTVDLAATVFHSDEFFWDANERVREPSYTTLSARASWQPRDSKFRLSLWGRNLTDERHSLATFLLETYDGISYAKPRTYGIGVEYAF
ncbi:MAG: TonB-dependent receptor [Gammaproteobacteria bacterium]|nr:TonB-dependent receptor [Gammaproteobacteria bacterium]